MTGGPSFSALKASSGLAECMGPEVQHQQQAVLTSFPPGPAAFLSRHCAKGGKFALSEVFTEQDGQNEIFLSSNTPNPAALQGWLTPDLLPQPPNQKPSRSNPQARSPACGRQQKAPAASSSFISAAPAHAQRRLAASPFSSPLCLLQPRQTRRGC